MKTTDDKTTQLERAVCAVICRRDGIKAREIASALGLDRRTVNHILYSSPLMKELCWQDREYRWHGLVAQARPHAGLREFSGWTRVGSYMLSTILMMSSRNSAMLSGIANFPAVLSS